MKLNSFIDEVIEIVASSREDAWIETRYDDFIFYLSRSRPPARTRGLKLLSLCEFTLVSVASSREDAWIETLMKPLREYGNTVASSREDAWIETVTSCQNSAISCRVLPRGRVD